VFKIKRQLVLSRLFPIYSPNLLQQRADHADQHADNQQGRGIKSQIVHGILSFAFCLMTVRRGAKEKVPRYRKILNFNPTGGRGECKKGSALFNADPSYYR
jgi:hypothetical protein